MADRAGKFQIVIKGGQPWGFRLHGDPENRFAVIVDQIEPGGKAETQGELKRGDHVIKINDVQCLSLSDALQLIDSAFRTLTILVRRPPDDSNKINSNKNSVFNQKSFFSSSNYCQNSASSSMLSSVFHEFQDYKDNISTQKLYRRVSHASLTNNYENISSLNLLNSQTVNLKINLQCSVAQSNQAKILENLSSEDNSLKNYRSMNGKEIVVKQNNFLDLVPTPSNHDTNLQFVCEKVPLPQIFFSNSSDLKLNLQPIHSKASPGSLQLAQNNNQDVIKKHETSLQNSSGKEITANKIAKISYCMYPNCSSKNVNCTIHSPPEKDDAQHVERNGIDSQRTISISKNYSTVEQISCHIYANANNDAHHLPSISLKENTCISELNSQVESVNYDKYNAAGYTSVPNHCDTSNTLKYSLSQSNEYLQDDCKNVCASTMSKGLTQCSDQPNIKFVQSERKNCTSKHQFEYEKSVNRESIPNVSVRQTMLVDQAGEIKLVESESFRKEAMKLSLFKESASNLQLKNSAKKKCFLDEKKSVFSDTKNNTCLKFSENRTVMKLYTHTDEKDCEEDEELCFIVEKVKNILRPVHTLCASPDLPLPPPPINSHSEIIPTNEPLPPPPCLSPVADLMNHEKPEALYANLEMLKIDCAVVNSSTQTATSSKQQTKVKSDSCEEVENVASFSCFSSEAFNSMLAPAFEKTLTNSVIKNLLRQQLQKPTAKKSDDVSCNAEKEVTIERHSLSLPLTSAYFTTSEPKAKLLTRYVSSFHEKNMAFSGELSNKKEELMESITKKLDVLKLEQVALQEEVKQNDELGKCIADKIEKVAKPHENEKFHLQVEELVKITNLMLSLSGRLARAENALLILPSNASEEEKAVLGMKYSKLKQQYEEALFLKSNIDKRNNHLSLLLQKYFNEDDLTDYDHFIRMKAKLLVDLKELDEKVKLGEEQLSDLQSSVNSCIN